MISTETYQLKSAQPLTEAYTNRTDPRIEALYGYHAGNEQDWTKRLDSLRKNGSTRADASSLAEVLRAYNEKAGGSAKTMEGIELLSGGAPVVIGGQQASLWTGPLLVIHKAVSILGAAKSAGQQLGTPVVPVFWIAGEDHDWDEANHAYVITAEQELSKLTAERPQGPRTSVSRSLVSEEQWRQLADELEQALPHSEFKGPLLEQIRQSSEHCSSLSELFAKMLTMLFGNDGLVLLDADDPQLRKLEAPMFQQMLLRNDELEEAYVSAAHHVKELGYALQADVNEGSANLFLFNKDNGDERTLLYKRDGGFEDRKGSASWSKEELLQILEEHPQQFSNNVLTRPIMQDYLFPVLATVLGPGEIAYWALTGGAFRVLGMEMPIIVPRMSFTLIEGTIAKYMTKYELSFADVMERFEERKEQWLKEQDELAIEQKFGEVKTAFAEMYEPLLQMASNIQPGLAKLGDTNKQKILEQIGFLESKTTDAFNKQFEASIRQLERIRLAILPGGKPQERMLTMAVYWNRYGDAWLQKIMEVPYCRTGGHEIVFL
ncbi:bacillithiol biosynthesis cysteine-adding enzyme BshC [Paenibacillus sp. HB172176]|uniref:bacillithiol biosynthesis cysteine-adding enzyme BshC n=1 Tax=Paenibacillus sp. HB172176 TaxID=2493690 RepID=UPI00143B34F2|nr:bacillithiol biosynthesis cysteine-adding enzyme BshC [Paenibacillus sp. HB172176]